MMNTGVLRSARLFPHDSHDQCLTVLPSSFLHVYKGSKAGTVSKSALPNGTR